MPTSYSSLSANVSGQSSPGAGPETFVTFDAPYLGYQGNATQFANQDEVPSWMFFSGTPKPFMDSMGNMVWRSANADGSLPA